MRELDRFVRVLFRAADLHESTRIKKKIRVNLRKSAA
jgi:hypothetical protein